MDDKLRATIAQKVKELDDEQARQLLDYIEFLHSKYNRSSRDRSPFEKLADNVEGTLRATKIGGAAIKGTTQVLEAASSVVRGVAEAGMAVVDELQRLDQPPAEGSGAITEAVDEEKQEVAQHEEEATPDSTAPTEQAGRADDEAPESKDKTA
jgi:hypothetical protein